MHVVFRNIFLTLFFFILLTSCSQQSTKPGHSEWRAYNSGLSDNVSVLVIDHSQSSPHVLYIGTFTGIYKRESTGDWTSVQNGLPLQHISAVAVHPRNSDHVYCGTWGRGLYRSRDGGNSWENIWPGTASPHIAHISLTGADYRGLWIGTENGIFYSSDRGDNWQHVMDSGSIKTIKVHPMNPDIIYAGVDIKGNFKSTDGGQTWNRINNGVHTTGESTAAANTFVIHEQLNSTLFMSTGWVDVYKSVNAGNSWIKTGDLLTEMSVQDLIQDPVSPDRYWAATQYQGVYISDNGAVSWQAINGGLPQDTGTDIRIHDLEYDSQNGRVLYAGLNSYGIYRYVLE